MAKTCNSASHDPPSIPQNPPSIPQHPKIPQTPENPTLPHQDVILQQLSCLSTRLDEMDATIKQQNKSESSKGKEISGSKGSYWGDGRDEEHDVPWWMKSATRRPHTKMEFPKFEGGDPRGWILKAEKYFRYYQTLDELKVDIAVMYLEELVKALNENYGPAEFQNPDEFLCDVQQLGSVQEYRQEFAKRAARVKNWPEHCLLGLFLRRLKPELKADVRVHKPRSVYKAMSLALEFEQNNKSHETPPQSSQPSSSQQTQQARTNSRPWDTERQQRISKGLCFRCNERFAPGHRCKTTSLTLMEIDDAGNPIDEAAAESDCNEQAEEAEVTFHAILGNTISTTMKLNGTLGSHKVLILVDSGSTHNFISSQFVNKLQLPTQKVSPFGVKIGNDVVLGIRWLASLNTVRANWNEMFLIFNLNGKQYKLQGVVNGSHATPSFQYLSRESEITVGTTPLYFQKGVDVDRSKIQSVLQWPTPVNVKELRGFLGLTGYYRRFVQNYGQIARPLTDLTKKNAFHWSPAAELAFNTLKQALTTVPVLQMPNFSTTFTIKSTYDRELLALVLALQKWKHYLMGKHFIVRTDHSSLQCLLKQRATTTEQQRLLIKLLPFDFTIVHKSGKQNSGADALSRRPQHADFLALSLPHPMDFANWRDALYADPFTRKIMEELTLHSTSHAHFHLANNKLYYKDKLVVPEDTNLRQKLLFEAHNTAIAGHGGY
ncbi:retrotransposon gag domain, Retroviral aspartyl protease [Senna tora]|uniref:RNA-directed DNA polymerase n=1 Tax=Senna tora TaxID=362788 RepID=A0A834WYB0_9FABA|nr:retrotransposon gag domain, Retroviral aspartyl protease [Senna tora]